MVRRTDPIKSLRRTAPKTAAPFLVRVTSLPEGFDPTSYPFNVRAFSRGLDLDFRTRVSFFVGENGTGKSTLLEAIAECCRFNPEGGHAQFIIATHSPILLAFPGAALFSLDGETIEQVDYRDTKHFLITRDFLNGPERFFGHVFEREDSV